MIRTSSLIVFACKSKACAPPPVGSGGSKPSSSASKYNSGDPRYEMLYEEYRLPGRPEFMHSADLRLKLGRRISAMDHGPERDVLEAMYDGCNDYTWSGYSDVNELLRGTLDIQPDEDGRLLTDRAEKIIDAMDKAFDSSYGFSVPLRKRTTVYRGMLLEVDPSTAKEMFTKGSVVEDKGFVSTSLNIHDARRFYHARYPGTTQVLVQITANPGTRVIVGNTAEQELILNRGHKFKVTSVKDEVDEYGDKTGRLLVNMQVLRGTMSK